jgi:hypothetical protein
MRHEELSAFITLEEPVSSEHKLTFVCSTQGLAQAAVFFIPVEVQ